MELSVHAIALISVVVGLGLAELLGRLNALIQARHRVRWHPLPLAWALIALVLVNNYWWGLYLGNVSAVRATDAASFLPGLLMPILLYLLCAAALPRPADADQPPTDLREAYFGQRIYFFGLLLAYALAVLANTYAGAAFTLDIAGMQRLALVVLTVSLLLVRSPWYHGLATVLVIALLVTRMTMQVLRA